MLAKSDRREGAEKSLRVQAGSDVAPTAGSSPMGIVHHFTVEGQDYGYFSSVGLLLRLTEEAAAAVRAIEQGCDVESALLAVQRRFGRQAAQRVASDLSDIEEAGAFEGDVDVTSEDRARTLDVYERHCPRSIMLLVTERCNLRCTYCYESANNVHCGGAHMREESGRALLRSFFERSGRRRHLKITFFGGEPLLNWSVIRALVLFAEELARSSRKHVSFTMTTNGTLLDEEIVDFLVEHRFTVMVSIDGDRQTHDANRRTAIGRGTHEAVSRNLRMLIEKMRAAGLRAPCLRATYVTGNGSYDAVRQSLLEYGVGEDLVLVGRAMFQQDGDEDRVEREPCGESFDRMRTITRQALSAALAGERPSPHIVAVLQKIDAELSCPGPRTQTSLHGLCGVCRNMLAVTPDGDAYPCQRYVGMDAFRMGNLLHGGPDRQAVRSDYTRNLESREESCGRCWARHLCGGSCPWERSRSNGKVVAPRESACDEVRYGFELSLAMYSELHAVPGKLKPLLSPPGMPA